MYETTKIEKAVLWHAKDGVRNVSVQMVAGAKPFGTEPSEIGVQLIVCDSADGDKPLAVLYFDPGGADLLSRDENRHSAFAREFRQRITDVMSRG